MSVGAARKLRRNMTKAEAWLWSRLRRKQIDGYRFRRQAPLGPYVVDFLCFDARLVVEVDGGQHASSKTGDTARTRWLEAQDFRVLRYWNHEVLGNGDGVIEAIRFALKCAPPPLPSPARGEGDDPLE